MGKRTNTKNRVTYILCMHHDVTIAWFLGGLSKKSINILLMVFVKMVWLPDCEFHSKSELFSNQPLFDHSKSGRVRCNVKYNTKGARIPNNLK